MGIVMKYIVDNSDNRISSYDTLKQVIDESSQEIFGDYDDHEENSKQKMPKPCFAETEPSTTGMHGIDMEQVAKKQDKSPFKYFLDGSRHVYKTCDMVIAGNVYPVVAGQIIVGCCKREDRNIVKHDFIRKIVLAVPQQFVYDKQNGQTENYLRKRCIEINEEIKKHSTHFQFEFSRLICYNTDGDIEQGRNKYLHQAITVIQNEMMDQEQIMVGRLCTSEDNILNNASWLVKDGTLEYKREFTNRPDENLDIAQYKHKLKNVIGISKNFDAELLSSQEPKIGKIIAELPPYHRTNAYRYVHQKKTYCVWYLRLRNTPNRATRYSDVVKVEFIMPNETPISLGHIDTISTHLINEAYPVCFGKDTRWANHLYPVYLTEAFCKSQYMNDSIIVKMI